MSPARLRLVALWPVQAVLVVAACAGFLAPFVACAQIDQTSPNPDRVLNSRGPDQAEVIRLLKSIQTQRLAADRRTANILVKGRFSRTRVPWKDGIVAPAAELIKPTEWQSFTLARRGMKARFEEAYISSTKDGPKEETAYRLMDGESAFKLDGNALYISGLKDHETRWNGYIWDYSSYSSMHVGFDIVPLAVGCQILIDRIDGRRDTGYWKRRVLRCYSQEGLQVLEDALLDPPAGATILYKVWIDPAKGHRVVRTRFEDGGPGQAVDYAEESRITVEEVVAGVLVDTRALTFISDLGTVAKKDKSAGWLKRQMETQQVKIDDFEYDEQLFDRKSLPIPRGALVTDQRHDPPLVFNHGQAPLDEEVLRGAANKARSFMPKRSSRSIPGWLIWGPAVVAFGGVAVILIRQSLKRGKAS